MSSSPKSRFFFADEVKTADKSEFKANSKRIPPQIKRRTRSMNGKMLSDPTNEQIKEAIRRISERDAARFKTTAEYLGMNETQRVQALRVRKYRRYTKDELSREIGRDKLKALGFSDGLLPYSVYFVEIVKKRVPTEIFAALNKGIGEFDAFKDDSSYEDKLDQNILGRGKYGIVKVMQDLDNPFVCYALKIIRPEQGEDEPSESKEDFYTEQAELLLGRLVRFSMKYACEQEELIMEWVPGLSIRKFLELNVRVTPAKMLSILRHLFTATKERIHQFGDVHRDIKPDNFIVFYETETNDVEVGLVDYGLAGTPDKETGIFSDEFPRGTPGYMAPEIMREVPCPYSQRTDIYAIGVTMAELLSKVDYRDSFARRKQNLFNFICEGYSMPYPVSENIIPNKEIANYLDEFIQILTAKDNKARPDVWNCEAFMLYMEGLNAAIEKSATESAEKFRKAIQGQLSMFRDWANAKFPEKVAPIMAGMRGGV